MTRNPGAARLDEFLALVLRADQAARDGALPAARTALATAEKLVNYDDVAGHRKRMTMMVASTRAVLNAVERKVARAAQKAELRSQKAAEQARLRCAACGEPGSLSPVKQYGQRLLCGQCWGKARAATCTECLTSFLRPNHAPRTRLCPSCQTSSAPSRSLRTTGGGLPGLGKRH